MSRPASKAFLEALRSSRDTGRNPPGARPTPSGKVTLAQCRTEAQRAFGAEFRDALDDRDGACFTVRLEGWQIDFAAKGRMAARRRAYKVLRRMPNAEGGA